MEVPRVEINVFKFLCCGINNLPFADVKVVLPYEIGKSLRKGLSFVSEYN
jgi:hypothetical protein